MKHLIFTTACGETNTFLTHDGDRRTLSIVVTSGAIVEAYHIPVAGERPSVSEMANAGEKLLEVAVRVAERLRALVERHTPSAAIARDRRVTEDAVSRRARDLYATYCASSDGRNYQGLPCPAWDQLTDAVRGHWYTVALRTEQIQLDEIGAELMHPPSDLVLGHLASPEHGLEVWREYSGIDRDHQNHGRGTYEEGPDHSDCPCRSTERQTACARAGCGFCAARVRTTG